jgi:TonB family protein
MKFETTKTWEGRLVDGRFPLQQWLGASTCSAVFQTEMGSAKAAIKLVAADMLDANLTLLRWQQTAQLSHPRLLRLLTQGRCEIEGTRLLYVVMEYADENLSEILSQRALTAGETFDLLNSVLDALTYLHRQGFVHGHIQPSNILAQGNQIKLAMDRMGTCGEPSAGALRGTVYDAPELRTEALSPTVDVWSIGVTLVAALTQHAIVHESSLYKDVQIPAAMPEPFRSIARDCLRRDPAQRCKIAEMNARLKAAPREAVPTTPPAKGGTSRLRFAIPMAAILLLVAFMAPRLIRHDKESSAQSVGKNELVRPSPAPSTSPPPPANDAPPRVSNGSVARQVLPPVPQSARNTIHGKVRVAVRVQVDPSGKVASATLASPGPSRYFARLALAAAEQWQFTPPQSGGQPVPSAWLLQFYFRRTHTEVFPTQEHR